MQLAASTGTAASGGAYVGVLRHVCAHGRGTQCAALLDGSGVQIVAPGRAVEVAAADERSDLEHAARSNAEAALPRQRGAPDAAGKHHPVVNAAWEEKDQVICMFTAHGHLSYGLSVLRVYPAAASPRELFLHFMPVEYLNSVVVPQTNRRGCALFGDAWTDVTLRTLWSWIGLVGLMTTSLLCERGLYWQRADLFPVRFGEVMSREQFSRIKRALMLADDDDPDDVRGFADAFNAGLRAAVLPGSTLGVGERMEPWFGKVAKPPWARNGWLGAKAPYLVHHATVDAGTGIIVSLEIAEPKEDAKKLKYSDRHRSCVAAALRMTEPWHGSGRVVVGGAWFGRPECAAALMKHGLHSILKVSGCPKWPLAMPPAVAACAGDDDLIALVPAYGAVRSYVGTVDDVAMYVAVQRDRRPRVVVATASSVLAANSITRVVQADRRRSQAVEFSTRNVFVAYANGKGCVDVHGELQGYLTTYSEAMRVKRWMVRLLCSYVGIAASNAFLVARKWQPGTFSPCAFRERLSLELCGMTGAPIGVQPVAPQPAGFGAPPRQPSHSRRH